jgi:hypothetical protein
MMEGKRWACFVLRSLHGLSSVLHVGRGGQEQASFFVPNLFFVYDPQMHGVLYVVGREDGKEEENSHYDLGGK